jgi:hypothetical protein
VGLGVTALRQAQMLQTLLAWVLEALEAQQQQRHQTDQVVPMSAQI